jgi:hypothetical protein
MFLPASLTAMANRHVKNSPADALPRFRRDVPHVTVGGAILRYSSETPAPTFKPVPGGHKMVR